MHASVGRILATLSLALAFAASAADLPVLRNTSPAFELRVEVFPSALRGYPLTYKTPPTFNASVVVTQPGTRYAYAYIENVEVKRGETRTVEKNFRDLHLVFRVEIDSSAEKAITTTTLSRAGRVLSRYQSTVWLQHTRPAGEPVQ